MKTLADYITTKRQAIAAVRAEANALIEQAERKAKGYDKGVYRDDDVMRRESIKYRCRMSSALAFELSARFQGAKND